MCKCNYNNNKQYTCTINNLAHFLFGGVYNICVQLHIYGYMYWRSRFPFLRFLLYFLLQQPLQNVNDHPCMCSPWLKLLNFSDHMYVNWCFQLVKAVVAKLYYCKTFFSLVPFPVLKSTLQRILTFYAFPSF